MNNVILTGRLARDPEISYTNTGRAITKFTLAVDRFSKSEEQSADFIRITTFGPTAENCQRYLEKGHRAAVLGRIQTGSYKNRDGQTVYTTDVVADRVEFLGGAGGENSSRSERSYSETSNSYTSRETTSQTQFGGFDDMPDSFSETDDDVPF